MNKRHAKRLETIRDDLLDQHEQLEKVIKQMPDGDPRDNAESALNSLQYAIDSLGNAVPDPEDL